MALFVLFFVFIANIISADGATGALIVSYHTGPEAERLDRIRFRLSDEKLNQRSFPREGHCVNEVASNKRIVVIDDLVPGAYTIEFLLPNKDRLFDDIASRSVLVKAGERTRVDQYFQPHYATLSASATTWSGGAPFVSLPEIVLEDVFQKVKARSFDGVLIVKNLIPGRYTLVFEDLDGYKTPEKITFIAEPGESIGPIVGIYQCQMESIMPEIHAEPLKLPPCMASKFLSQTISFSRGNDE